MNYTNLIKKAYYFTKSHPVVWLFGLFFTILIESPTDLNEAKSLSELAFTSGLLFVLLAITSWVMIVFVLYASDRLGIERIKATHDQSQAGLKILMREGRIYFFKVLVVSVGAVMLTLAVSAGFMDMLSYFPAFSVLWVVVFLIFIFCAGFLVLTASLATYFIILYQRTISAAFSLTLDLVFKKWKAVMGTAFAALLLYLGYFLMTAFVAILVRTILLAALPAWAGFSATILSTLVLFFLASLGNAFINVCLLLFFHELVKPPLDSEAEKSSLALQQAGSAAH